MRTQRPIETREVLTERRKRRAQMKAEETAAAEAAAEKMITENIRLYGP